MNLYELNQAGYLSIPYMTQDEIEIAKNDIREFLEDHPNNYYMMLNHEVRSFTIFHYLHNRQWPTCMTKEIIDVITSYGKLKAIEIQDEMIEFWVTEKDSVCRMYAFFGYDKGVIEV